MPMDAPFRITICGIPELNEHCAVGVTHVLSILDPEMPDPPAFADFAPHHRLALRFHDIIEATPGRIVPQQHDVERLLEFGRDIDHSTAPHVLIHCHAGVSRSTAATALILAQYDPGLPAADVLGLVAQIRPRAWPNLRILELGDTLLGRSGDLAAAAGPIYRRVLDRDPIMAELMTEGGRGREVVAGLSLSAPAERR
ncbi:MAG: protein-tyrosine-phosphatase [Alphaproteobacteria bacterium]|nr:protein-tyrosine-phosphatase [Alphaproteobacteria bacterium]